MPEFPEDNQHHSLEIAFSSSARPSNLQDPIVMAYGWTRAGTQNDSWTGGGQQITESITVGDIFKITIFDTDQSAEPLVRDDIAITAVTVSVKDEHGRSISPFSTTTGINLGGNWSHTSDELVNSDSGNKVNPSDGCKVMGRTWNTPQYAVAMAGKFKITIDLTLKIGETDKTFRVDPEVDIEGVG